VQSYTVETMPYDTREQALHILYRVETGQAFATRLLDGERARAGDDMAFLEQLVKGTLDWRGRLDSILDGVVSGGSARLTPWIRNILRLAAYQILYLDRVPPEIAVHQAVEAAKRHGHRGTAGLVNAVLRSLVRQMQEGGLTRFAASTDDPASIAAAYSHPQWLVERWISQIGVAETVALCAADNHAWPVCLRTNTLRINTPDLRACLETEGVAVRAARFHDDCTLVDKLPRGVRLHDLAAYQEGLFAVQDESSAFVALVVDPQPGETVVDLCSAPGGKTMHLVALMKNEGRIIAVDPHPGKLGLVEENAARLGATIVETRAEDGRTITLLEQADRVLVDTPCSGLGALGRHSDARWNKAADDLAGLGVLQQQLLHHAASLVKPGGRLVYSTCSIDADENEGAVAAFLETHPEYVRQAAPASIPAPLTMDGMLRTWPQRHDMGGAFGAVMMRRRASPLDNSHDDATPDASAQEEAPASL